MAYSIDSFPGRKININGTPHLYFGGTSYLGLQTDSQFQALLIKNIQKYGTSYGASRKSNIQISIYKDVEQHLATLVGSQDCVTLSSGFLAGQLVAQTLNSSNHELFYTPDTHAALYVPKKKHFASFESLNAAVRIHLEQFQSTPVVFLDTLDTEGLNYPDFKGLRQLPLDKIILVADDSHGIGIVGTKGGGTYRTLKALQPKELIVCCSLGKGFGIQAGAIFGKKQYINEFMNTNFFGGASPATPAALSLLLKATGIFEEKRAVIKKHIELFTNEVKNLSKFTFAPKHPSFTFSNIKLVSHLESSNIIVTNFKYPTEKAPLMNRIVLSAHHTTGDIERLLDRINSF